MPLLALVLISLSLTWTGGAPLVPPSLTIGLLASLAAGWIWLAGTLPIKQSSIQVTIVTISTTALTSACSDAIAGDGVLAPHARARWHTSGGKTLASTSIQLAKGKPQHCRQQRSKFDRF